MLALFGRPFLLSLQENTDDRVESIDWWEGEGRKSHGDSHRAFYVKAQCLKEWSSISLLDIT